MLKSVYSGVGMSSGRKTGRQRGYTLIEMAIVISVLGVIIAAFIGAYGLYHKTKVQTTTISNANRVVNALGHYLVQNGRYPCPARMDVSRDDGAYGMETDCTDTSLAVGNCANGLCVEQGERQVNINQNPGMTTNIVPRVRRGAIPFRILGLPENIAEDGNKNRMYYAVTENLTRTNTYRKDAGGISVLNESDVSIVTPASSAHFVVFSVGDDRRAAVTRYGQQYRPCAAPGTANDAINCHTGPTSPHNLARYRVADHSTATGAAHYDDYLRYYASVETPLWRVTGATSNDIVDLIDVGAGGRIGVGVVTPTADMQVVGDVRTNTNVMARQVCDMSGGDCFMVDAIGGESNNPPTAALQCDNPAHPNYDPARPYVTGYRLGVAECGTGNESMRCPPGRLLRGVSAAGVLTCDAVTGCAPISVNMCQINGAWQQAFIPSGGTGQIHQTEVFGASFYRRYRCQNGAWALQSSHGSCSCTEVTNQVVDIACNTIFGGPAAGLTGVAKQTYSRQCPSGAETWGPIDSSACTCAPLSNLQETRTCQQAPFSYPSGFSCSAGLSPRVVRDWTCSAPKSGAYTAYSAVAGSDCCNCAAGVRSTQWVSCGTGFNGTKEQERFTACPGFTAWADTGNNNCTCNSSMIDTDTQACPDGQVGVIQRRRDWDCAATPAPAWGPWYVTSNNCGPVTYQWVPKVTGEGPYGMALPNTAGTTCSTPAQQAPCSYPATGGYTHYSACRCE